MDPELHRRISEIFLQASELEPGERERFLDSACAADTAVRREVESLFAHDERAAGVVSPEMILPQIAELLGEAGSDAMPKQIGPYRILRKLGAGGMAVVYLAEQQQPIRRTVALKLIKWGMDTREVVARFEWERQALALMNHPGIAKVFEAGATSEGRPYFVMEYVQGIPITEHCDRLELPIADRLQLFLQVCDAVQHAHHKAVIHRDLKPSNVLVWIQDGAASPKIIDFGVAKAIAQRLTDTTLHTQLGALIGTPEYMSPEQAEMTSQDVDTRTDVYSLGVMLYEFLTGALPFDSKELRDSGFDEIRRRIREVDPPRPSAKIVAMGSGAALAARNRRAEPSSLIRELRGDLDWITMKALEKERTRRYGSPSELAADLARHLQHQPVVASPPSAVYRARKYARRHRPGVLVTAGLLILLMVFTVTMTIQARRIARERDRANREAVSARRVSGLLQRMFELSDLDRSRGNSITAREILDRASKEFEVALGNEPAIRAQLMVIMGAAYASLGLYPQAGSLLDKAVETRRRVLGKEDPDTLASMHALGNLRTMERRFDEAETILRDVLEKRSRVLGREHPDTLATMDTLAVLREAEGRRDEAAKIFDETIEKKRRVLGPEHPDTIRTMANLAALYESEDRFEEAERLDRESFAIMRRVLGPDHPDTLRIMNNLAVVYDSEDQFAEAEKVYEDALKRLRRVLGPEHPDTLMTMANLASVYVSEGRYPEGELLYREVLEIDDRVLGREHPDTLWVMRNLAVVYGSEGRHDEAAKLIRQVFEISRRVLGPEDPDTAATLYDMGVLALKRGHRQEALDDLSEAVDHGYANPERMTKDPDLETLHGDRRFETIVAKALAGEAKP